MLFPNVGKGFTRTAPCVEMVAADSQSSGFHRVNFRFQFLRNGQSQISFFGLAHSFFVSYLPRPRVVPTWTHPEALYAPPVKRVISTKVSIRTGATLVTVVPILPSPAGPDAALGRGCAKPGSECGPKAGLGTWSCRSHTAGFFPGSPMTILNQRPHQRHLGRGEGAPVIAALDLIAHGGLVKPLLRSSSIDQGSQGVRSSGGRPPFFAQAVSHAVSHFLISISFIRRVSNMPYIIAENAAPF